MPKDQRIALLIPDDLLEQIKAVCKQHDLTLSDFVRQAMTREIQREKNNPPPC